MIGTKIYWELGAKNVLQDETLFSDWVELWAIEQESLFLIDIQLW